MIFKDDMQSSKWEPVSLGHVFLVDCLIIWIW